ncbi:MAG: Cytochrome c biosis protein CcsA [Verrucomicrobiota bacterium]
MKSIHRLIPWVLLALFATEVIMVLLPKANRGLHAAEFGRLPVLLDGRIQPLDSVARNALLQIRSSSDAPLEIKPSWQFWSHGRKLRSSEWLLEVFFHPELADTRPIFLIHHPDLLTELRLVGKGLEKSGLFYFTFNELREQVRRIGEQGEAARQVKAEQQTPLQRQTVKLANALMLYQRLKNSLQPEASTNFVADLEEFRKAVGPGMAAAHASRQGGAYDTNALERLIAPLSRFEMLSRFAYPLVVPPTDPARNADDWQNVGASLMESARSGEIAPALLAYATMGVAYRRGDTNGFNQAVSHYRSTLLSTVPQTVVNKGRAEFYFNRVKPFLHATIIYIAAFVLACSALLTGGIAPGLSESLRRSSFYLILLAGAVHTFGLIFRMVLEGRPPVTNLYSSAIFIGWGALLLGIVLEWFFRVGLGSAMASVCGFITLLIAHNLAKGGTDTMAMLQAVLDTNFWLATHVVIITLGYSATFAAGLLAIAYVAIGLLTPQLQRPVGRGLEMGKAVAKMVYGIVCFATLFSFVGTILGGIWADQSWGRFWGWDPKENGALLIVLWNALILHARWGGLVRDRGLMLLTIVGNIVTAWSWFGTNLLGIGLHAYGFTSEGFQWLRIFVASQLLVIGLGLIPLARWRSFRTPPPDSPAPAAS